MTLPLAILICISLFSIVAVPLLLVHRWFDKKELEDKDKAFCELAKRLDDLRLIAATHRIDPIILEPQETKITILLDNYFHCTPNNLISLLIPFLAKIENAKSITIKINANGTSLTKNDTWLTFTAVNHEDLINHLLHVLHQQFTYKKAGKQVWRQSRLVPFKINLFYTKDITPVMPEVHYVKILETSEGFEEVDEDYLAAKQEVEAITAATRKYVNTRRIHE